MVTNGKVKSPYGNQILISGIITFFRGIYDVGTNMKFIGIIFCMFALMTEFFSFSLWQNQTKLEKHKKRFTTNLNFIKLQIYVNETFCTTSNLFYHHNRRVFGIIKYKARKGNSKHKIRFKLSKKVLCM